MMMLHIQISIITWIWRFFNYSLSLVVHQCRPYSVACGGYFEGSSSDSDIESVYVSDSDSDSDVTSLSGGAKGKRRKSRLVSYKSRVRKNQRYGRGGFFTYEAISSLTHEIVQDYRPGTRVSENVIHMIRDWLVFQTREVFRDMVNVAVHSKRQTIMRRDFFLVVSHFAPDLKSHATPRLSDVNDIRVDPHDERTMRMERRRLRRSDYSASSGAVKYTDQPLKAGNCAICGEELEGETATLKCKHSFHRDCWREYAASSGKLVDCPECGKVVIKK